MRPDLPTVPLEAGAGRGNPPCPACGEPLFVWLGMPGGSGVARRCEACGLGVLSRIDTSAEALVDLDRSAGPDGTVCYLNRASLQASFAGGAWSGLGSMQTCVHTPESIRRLVSGRDQLVERSRWLPGTGIVAAWQSVINMFTFGHNLVLGRLGRAFETKGRKKWHRGLDAFITVVVALPALILAVPLELIGALLRRGGAYRATFKVL